MKFKSDATEKTAYRIINLYVNNVKGIKAVDITPENDIVKIKYHK